MMKINSYIVNLYIPYIYFPNATIIFRKHRDLSEIEAIIYSFISENKTKSRPVLQTLFESFNIESSKWSEFFKIIINDSIKNKEIITDIMQIDDNTLFGEISLHKLIISNIRNHKFIGLDSKDVEHKIIFNKVIYESTCNNADQYIMNKKLLNISNLDIDFGSNLYDVNEINSILLDKIEEDINSSSEYYGLEPIRSIGLENCSICFNTIESILNIHINQSINIESSDKFTNIILNKFNEKNISALIIKSIEDSLNIENESFDFITNKNFDDINIINFIEYPKLLNEIHNLKSKFKINENILIEDGYLFNILRLKLDAFVLGVPAGMMVILCKQKRDNCYEWVINEIIKYNSNIIALLDVLNEKDKIKIIEYLVNNMEKYWDNILFKNYLFNDVLIENKLSQNKIWPILISNSITFEDYKKLLLNNQNVFINFINNIDEINNDQNNPLIDKKIIYTFDILKIDILKMPHSGIKNSLITKINNKFTSAKDYINKREFNENIDFYFVEMKSFIKLLNSNSLNSSFAEVYKQWESLKIKKREDLENDFALKLKKLQEKLEEFVLSNDKNEKLINFEDAIQDKELKINFKKIRIFRNDLTHNKKISQYDYKKLVSTVKLMNDYISWLDDNKNSLYKSVIKRKED